MAILDDDFQSYAIGTNLPFGSFTNLGSLFDDILAGGPDGTTRCFQLVGTAQYDNGGVLSSFTQYIGIYLTKGSAVLAFGNGPNSSGNSIILTTIKVENDGTVSIINSDNVTVANSRDKFIAYNTWNFFQVNVAYSAVLNGGVLCVNSNITVIVNGTSIVSNNSVSFAPVSTLKGSPTVGTNLFQMTGNALFSAYTLAALNSAVSYPHPGTPSCRVNQGVVEIATLPGDEDIFVHQGVVELAQLPVPNIWIHQGVIELLVGLGPCYISES